MMEKVTPQNILQLLQPRLNQLGIEESQVDYDHSLLEQGVLDSISFLEFMMKLEETFSVDFDFGEMDPTEFTSLNALAKIIQERKE